MKPIYVFQDEREKVFNSFLVACNHFSQVFPTLADTFTALREQAKKEHMKGTLVIKTKEENMLDKCLAPFKEIAKKLDFSEKGTAEERIEEEFGILNATKRMRRRATI